MMAIVSRQSVDESTLVEGPAAPVVPPEVPAAAQRKRWPRRLAETHSSRLPVLVWLVLALIWGSTWLFIKLGLEDLPPFTFAGIRFVIAVLILSAVVVLRGRKLPTDWRDWVLIAGTGWLAFTINFGLLFWGEQRTSSGLAAILQTIIPVFGLALAHLHLPSERITAPKLVGVVLGIAGVALIFSDQMGAEGSGALKGSVAIVIGAFGAAYSNVLVKARGGKL